MLVTRRDDTTERRCGGRWQASGSGGTRQRHGWLNERSSLIRVEPVVNSLDSEWGGLGWYLQVVKRRKWLLTVPLVLGLTISVAVALLQTSLYRSTATILIEDPEIPQELVSSTVTTYAEKRLQVITQRVMATDRLLEVMRQFTLYPEERRAQPLSVVAEHMREHIDMDIVNAEVVNPRSGRQQQVTVAFTLSFDHPEPETAQRVTNELVSLYLNQNIVERRQQAAETTRFLRAEAARIEREIARLEEELAGLKEQNAGSLPDQLEANRRAAELMETELRELARRGQAVQERTIYLESQLALMNQNSGGDGVSAAQQLADARAERSAALGRYTPDHPDVRRLERRIEALEQSAASEANGSEYVDPASIQLRAELAAAEGELKAVEREREAMRARLEMTHELLRRTPLIERDYRQIMRALEHASAAQQQVTTKLAEAELAEALEADRKAERFSLVEPPVLPDAPFKPDRRLILLVGFILSLFSGIGAVTVLEGLDDTVRQGIEVHQATGEAPLVVVPHLATPEELSRTWLLRGAIGASALVILVLGLSWVHARVQPLDLLAAQLHQRASGALGQGSGGAD